MKQYVLVVIVGGDCELAYIVSEEIKNNIFVMREFIFKELAADNGVGPDTNIIQLVQLDDNTSQSPLANWRSLAEHIVNYLR